MVAFANKARRNGVVSLDSDLETIQDPFLKQALMLAVDGTEPTELRKIMRVSLDCTAENEERLPAVFESAGGFSPTIGILGAVLGLIQVMQNLDNIQEVGQGIAVAFVATIYGVGIANLFFLPFAGKMRIRMRDDHQRREMMLEGVISILEGMNPRMLEVKLAGFLDDLRREKKERSGMRIERRKSNVSQDRWMVSYADFITLLFAFFVVLYAFVQGRQKKQMQVSESIDAAFRSLGIFPDSTRQPDNASSAANGTDKPAMPMNIVMGEDVLSPAKVKEDLEPYPPRTGADALQPGRHAHRLHADGPRRTGDQPARGRLLQLRLGHPQARDAPHAAPDRRLAWAAPLTICASRATPITFPSTPRNSTPTGSSPRPAPPTSPASSST